jgi:hypothetical protein
MKETPFNGPYRYWLRQIADATTIPRESRKDVKVLHRAAMLAHAYANAALNGAPPPPPPDVKGQLDLFATGDGTKLGTEEVPRGTN